MLKTALKPKWIAALVLALVVSGVFVLLSQWQFSRSLQTDAAPPAVVESSRPLVTTLAPGEPMRSDMEGQIVSATGHFDSGRQVIVASRMEGGRLGYWVVTAFVVDGAPVLKGAGAGKQTIIPVARGWLADPARADAPPSGLVHLSGRLLDPEAPVDDHTLPAGQVGALSTAQLVNLWQTSSYSAFIVSYSETVDGHAVGTQAPGSPLTAITVTAKDQGSKVNWLNIFYSVEWVVFAGFAVFLWWRLVADDYRRTRESHGDYDDDYDDETTPEPEVMQ